MPGMKQVVLAFMRVCEATHASGLAQILETLPATRKQLVRVALVGNIKDDPVALEVVDKVQSHCQFHHAQIRSKVSASLLHALKQKAAHLSGEIFELVRTQGAHIRGTLDPVQQRVGGCRIGHQVSPQQAV